MRRRTLGGYADGAPLVFHIDAFTLGLSPRTATRSFTGNPAGVVFLTSIPIPTTSTHNCNGKGGGSSSADGGGTTGIDVLRDTEALAPPFWMAAVAMELATPVTAFLAPYADGSFAIRWYTSGGAELGLCGHASLAVVGALWRGGVLPPSDLQGSVRLRSVKSGVLSARRVVVAEGATAADGDSFSFPAIPSTSLTSGGYSTSLPPPVGEEWFELKFPLDPPAAIDNEGGGAAGLLSQLGVALGVGPLTYRTHNDAADVAVAAGSVEVDAASAADSSAISTTPTVLLSGTDDPASLDVHFLGRCRFNDIVLHVSPAVFARLSPDFAALSGIDARIITVTTSAVAAVSITTTASTPAEGVSTSVSGGNDDGAASILNTGSGFDIVSRCFAPRSGTNEDYVCGSAHCQLASYWTPILLRSRAAGNLPPLPVWEKEWPGNKPGNNSSSVSPSDHRQLLCSDAAPPLWIRAYQASSRGGELHMRLLPRDANSSVGGGGATTSSAGGGGVLLRGRIQVVRSGAWRGAWPPR